MCISAWRKYFYYCTFRIGQIIVNSAIEFRVHKPEIIEEHFCVMSICWPSTFGKHHPLLGCWPKNRPNPLTPSNWQCVERTIFCRIVDFGPTSCSQLFEYASIRLFECALCGGVAAQHGHLTVQPWVIFGYASLKVLSSSCQSGLCGSWLPTSDSIRLVQQFWSRTCCCIQLSLGFPGTRVLNSFILQFCQAEANMFRNGTKECCKNYC